MVGQTNKGQPARWLAVRVDPVGRPILALRTASLAVPVALTALVVLLSTIVRPAPARAQPQAPGLSCPDNRLANPGFEAGFAARGRVAEVVGQGWTPWYETLPGTGGLNYPPDYRPARRGVGDAAAVHSGSWSQAMATEDATHTGGLWQQVAVPPGSELLAWVWAYAWATGGEDPARSEPPGTYALQLGIDPAGGTDPKSGGIVWTAPITVTDTWLPLSLTVPVHASAATLFLRGQALGNLAHNLSRWDSACLRVLGPIGQPTAEPSPTARPSRVPPTLAPGQPTPTPSAATAEAILADFARATARAVALEIKAATRAAGGDGGPAALGPQGPAASSGAAGSGVMLGMPGADGVAGETAEALGGAGPDAGLPIDQTPPPLPLRAVIADHAGILALGLAAFAGGLLLGLGRERST